MTSGCRSSMEAESRSALVTESKCPKIGGSKCPRANVRRANIRNKGEQMSQNRGSKCPESKCYTNIFMIGGTFGAPPASNPFLFAIFDNNANSRWGL